MRSSYQPRHTFINEKITFFLLAILLITNSVKGQNSNSLSYQENVVLHIATNEIENDMVLFRANLLPHNATKKTTQSTVLNVALLDTAGVIVKKQYHKIINGEVLGALEIPKKLKKGHYYIEAYTKWMQNFPKSTFARQPLAYKTSLDLSATKATTAPLVTVEGGTLIEGIENKVIVSFNEYWNSSNDYTGSIIDNDNNAVSTIQNYSNTLGIAFFTPEANKTYSVKFNDDKIHRLPAVVDNGFVINVNNLDPYTAKVRVIASNASKSATPTLEGYSNGVMRFSQKLQFKSNSFVDIDLDKYELPQGILELKLIDSEQNTAASRPMWIDKDALLITIEPKEDASQATHIIKVTDSYDNPIETKISLSALLKEGDSTMQNRISDVTVADQKKEFFLKDLELLASYNNMADGIDKKEEPKYKVQKGIDLIGRAFNLENKILRNTTIQIVAPSTDPLVALEATTNDLGILHLKNLEIYGDAELIFRTDGKDSETRIVKLEVLDNLESLEKLEATSLFKKDDTDDKVVTTPSKKDKNRKDESFKFDDDSMVLDEVKIAGRGKPKRKKLTPSIYNIEVPPNRIKFQDYDRPKSLPALLAQVAGVQVYFDPINPSISIPRANGNVLFVLDGIPIAKAPSSPSTGSSSAGTPAIAGLSSSGPRRSGLADIMTMVNPSDIERIEILMDSDAAIFGTRGAGGVVAIYTRNGAEYKTVARKEGSLSFRGFEPEITFEEYFEGLSKKEKKNNPLVVWDTSIKTDENGIALIQLPKAKTNKKLTVNVSAISLEGEVGNIKTTM